MGWAEFALAYAVFLASHAVPVRPPVKRRLVARFGRAGFGIGYSALSLAALVWVISAAGRAPYLEIWPPSPWLALVTLAAMLLACQIAAFAAFRPNPLSFGGFRNQRFNPSAPGIVGWLRHPWLAALALWAAGHLAPNGDLAHLLLFGGFAGFALLGMAMIDRRRRREIGAEAWAAMLRESRAGRRLALTGGAALRAIAGLVLAAALVALHPVVIGVPVPGF